MISMRNGALGSYYGTEYNAQGYGYLSAEQKEINAIYITSYFLGEGWSKNAIAATLGNMEQESTLNPGLWYSYGDTSKAYGIVQWNPGTNLISWCSSNGYTDPSIMDAQLKRISYELKNNLQWIATNNYDLSFAEYSKSNESVEYLTMAFFRNYERAGDDTGPIRVQYAEKWSTFLSSVDVITFSPRLTDTGIQGSFYWYSQNPFYIAGYGLPNCTCYAWGRFWEISDPKGTGENKPNLPTGDAGTWILSPGGYETGNTPKLGAVICFSDNSGGAGHVAIVEQILDNGDLVTSNSAWNSTFFYPKTVYKSDGYNTPGYSFQGFIYNPFVTYISPVVPDPTPKPTAKKKRGYNFILFNRRKRAKQWTRNHF